MRFRILNLSVGLFAALGLVGVVVAVDVSKADKPAATRPTTQAIVRFESAKAVNQLYLALKSGDLVKSKTFVAESRQPVADLDRRLARLAKTYADDQLEFLPLDAKENGDVAVVIVSQSRKGGAKIFEAEEWYLIRQGGGWKLLGKFNDYEFSGYGFDEKRLEKYRELEKWAEERAGQLRKELTGCDC